MSEPVVNARACTERASASASGSVCTRTSANESPSAPDICVRTPGSSRVPRPRWAAICAVTWDAPARPRGARPRRSADAGRCAQPILWTVRRVAALARPATSSSARRREAHDLAEGLGAVGVVLDDRELLPVGPPRDVAAGVPVAFGSTSARSSAPANTTSKRSRLEVRDRGEPRAVGRVGGRHHALAGRAVRRGRPPHSSGSIVNACSCGTCGCRRPPGWPACAPATSTALPSGRHEIRPVEVPAVVGQAQPAEVGAVDAPKHRSPSPSSRRISATVALSGATVGPARACRRRSRSSCGLASLPAPARTIREPER